jgi:N-acetylglucosaminyldiphosphoundecaprenol N-acetyl-beta-D-mannosaminyltransferase
LAFDVERQNFKRDTRGVDGRRSMTGRAGMVNVAADASANGANAPHAVSTAGNLSNDSTLIALAADDLSREVYCILGMPIDAVEMPVVLRRIEIAASGKAPYVISTPNLNFLVSSQEDSDFRESLLESDLCTADGMPIVWIAKFMEIPIKGRVAGSDTVEALKLRPPSGQPLKLFLFGATEGVAAAAAIALNVNPAVLTCAGWASPGFETIEELNTDRYIDEINASGADFLVVALGARKGQLWLSRNRRRLQIPVRANLGATINFQAGTVKRAPHTLRKLGLEWLWRIKEEPYLWRRYWNDGRALLWLMVTKVAPLAIEARMLRWQTERHGHDLVIDEIDNGNCVTLRLSGFAVARSAEKAESCFRNAIMSKKQFVIDFSRTRGIDARFLGLLLMVRKQLKAQGKALRLVGILGKIERSFRLNGLEYLLPHEKSS